MRLSAFLGRDDDQARLVELVTTAPLVTVTGPGGIGKTRLVHEAADDLRARMIDEVVFAELASLPAGADVEAINGQLGFPSPEAAGVALCGRGAVLVLDNCEHVLDAVAEFVSRFLLAGESARIIATSREPLGVDGEHVVLLAPLDVPAGDLDIESSSAVRLFIDRSSSAGATWERSPEALSSVSELCRRLDGLPLAIELAAARTRAMTPTDILANIDSRLELLRRPALRGRSARHNSIRAAIDTSVDLLDDDERRAFRRLGAFAGPFDMDLAHAVIGDGDRLDTLDMLARLVDRSLVVAEQVGPLTHYRLLELLRDHARDALVRADEWDDVHERFVDAMAGAADDIVANGIKGWSAALVARIASEFHNLGAAIDWCTARDDGPERALRLFLPMFSSIHQSRSPEVLDIGDRIFARWPDQPAPWRAEALAVLATAAAVSGDASRALTLARSSLDDHDGTAIARVVAHRAAGFATRAQHDYDAAAVHFSDALAEAMSFGAASYARELTGFVASIHDMQGHVDEALEIVDRAIEEVASADDPINETWLRLVRSTVLMRGARWEEAAEETALAQATAQSLLYPWWGGAVLRQLAILAAYDASIRGVNHGWRASVTAWRTAVEDAASRGSTREVSLTLRTAAAVASRLGEHDAARALMEAVPETIELTVMAELFADEERRLEADHAGSAPAPDLPEALRRARAILVDEAPPAAQRSIGPSIKGALVQQSDAWEITYADRTARVKHLKGLFDLATLLQRPDVDVHCLELIGGVDVGDAGPTLDDRARREYQHRIEELQREIDEASADNDPARAERAELELDALVEQLSEAFGLGGRTRSSKSSVERARTAVTYRIRAAIRRLGEVHPELGRHLDNAIRTGIWCSYRPEVDVSWNVGVE